MINTQEITLKDLARGRRLKLRAVAAPVILTLLPAILTFFMVFFFVGGTETTIIALTVGAIATAIGFLSGMVIALMMARKHSLWTQEMRERMAANGIKAEQINWFRNELKPAEKRALKAVEARDQLLADAYRETLASRLTAARIVRSSKRELLLAKKRQGTVKQLKSQRADDFQKQIVEDIEKIGNINNEAKLMLAEAESRLEMIEAAASRGGTLADSELALKKLSARTAELPLALESAKLTEEIRRELEKEELE